MTNWLSKKKLGNPRQECWSLFHLVVSQGDPFQVLSNFRDQLNVYFFMDIIILMSWLLGNSGKPVTLETLSLTEFSKYVFQQQGIRDSRKPGTCGVTNSRMCGIRESWFGEEAESRTCGSPESRLLMVWTSEKLPIRESDEDSVWDSGARTSTNLLGSKSHFGNLLKTKFGNFGRRHSRTMGEAKSKL
jgi:hypothetical protein